MRQLDAELRRLFARRIVRGTFIAAALIVVIAVTIGTAKGHRGAQYAADPLTGRPMSGSVPVSGAVTPRFGPDDGAPIYYEKPDTRTNIAKDLENVFQGTGVALLFAGFALGASFVGAEFNVGSLTTQLLFEPRRWRVHLAKTVAVTIGTALVALGVLAFLAGAMYVGSLVKGVVRGVDASFVVHRGAQALRIAAAVGAGAAMAYCVTLVARRSSAGMIAFFLQYPLLFLLDPAKMPFGVISHYEPLRALLGVVIEPALDAGANERAIHTVAGAVSLTVVWLVVLVTQSGALFARAEVR